MSHIALAKILKRRESKANAIRLFMRATSCSHLTAVNLFRHLELSK